MPFINEILIFLLAIPLGLGVGGGGLLLIYLTDILQLPRETAVYLNLVFFLSALLASAASHIRRKRISYPVLGKILLFSVPCVLLGRVCASLLSDVLLRILLGSFLLFSGIFTLWGGKKAKDASNALDKR